MKPIEDPKVISAITYLLNELVNTRKDLRIKQTTLAKNLGISRGTYRFKEQGLTPFTLPEFIKVSQLLDLQFLTGDRLRLKKTKRLSKSKLERAHKLLTEILEIERGIDNVRE